MADVKICDRCGKRFTHSRTLVCIDPIRYILLVETRGSDHSYDLCLNCRDSLERFLSGKAVDAIQVDES